MTCQLIEAHQCFGGIQSVYAHFSVSTNSEMRFAIYLPPVSHQKLVPVLYWLSGLTCSEQNFITKAGAQRMAAELGIAIIVPDTSPRGLSFFHDMKNDAFGEGAGFYIDATEMPWATHYQMYTYVSRELPSLIADNFPVDSKRSGIFGHSMGGHGALMIGLKNHQLFRSISAFAPICAPTEVPWGMNAFAGYLGDNRETWLQYDSCHLMRTYGWPHGEILIDQGDADPYLTDQLKPERFVAACREAKVPLNLRIHEKYGHNYYFIATFIEDHLRFHAEKLMEN